MRRQSSLWRLAIASVGLLMFSVAASAQPCPSPTALPTPTNASPTPEVYIRVWATPSPSPTPRLVEARLDADSPEPRGRLPVLFVHGHNLGSSNDSDRNYRKNWQESLSVDLFVNLRWVTRNLPSFMQTLDLSDNADLGIEDYYIRFQDQGRSIADDAAEIRAAIEMILRRHDPGYANRGETNVQVVIIAYSKGTISTRLYLKNLAAENRSFRPVSEFIAISPPNHGLNSSSFFGTSTSGEQLRNGYNEDCASFGNAESLEFFTNLNGHSICDTKFDPNNPNAVLANYDSEAPGSRPSNGKPTDGVLYVTLYSEGNRDFVGGHTIIHPPDDDCQGRVLARNLSSNAVNIPLTVAAIIDATPSSLVHQRTVHTPRVICKALYAAVHHRSPEGEDCSLPADSDGLPVIPKPARAAVMLSLDFSGSMEISTGLGSNRASDLREAVRLFVELWGVVGVPSDRIGVNYFSTNVTPFPPSSNPVLPLSTNGPAIIAALPSATPRGMTAMGNGLQQAIESLTSTAPDASVRRVILFTDGIQNVNPMARIANGQVQFVTESGRPTSNVSPTAPAVLDPLLGIAVDTIAVGDANLFVGDLQAIAATTDGQSRTTLNMGLLRQFFIETLINALKGFSPQLVAYRRGSVGVKGSTEAFVIEDGVRKLVLKTSWKQGESLDFSVAKDGVDVTSAGRFINADFYKIFVMDLPAKGPVNARGNWQVQIKGNAGTAYEAAAIVDGSPIKYESDFNLKQPRAGEPLDLVVRLTAGGQPISGTSVFVTLLSPTMTAGDIIAAKPLQDPPAFEPGMSIGERQLLAFSQDPRRLALLKPQSRKVALEPNGKGEFRTRLDTPVPGVYTAFISIEGNDPKLGQFTRIMTATAMVRFANPDRKATDIFVIDCDADAGRRYVRIFLSPRDTNRHFMGPGSAADVALELSNGRMIGGTRDLGDGSYALLFEVERGNDPMVTLRVAGAALFSGRLSELRKFRQ